MKKKIHKETEMVKAVKELESGCQRMLSHENTEYQGKRCIAGSQNTAEWTHYTVRKVGAVC